MTPEEVVAQFLGTNKEIEAAQERGSQAVRRRAASGRPNMGYGDLIAREERLRSARDDNTSRLALVEKYIKDREVGERLRRSMAVQEAPNTPALSPEEVAALRLYEARRREARPKPTSALDIIREELPKFFRDNQELSDEVGDLSLKEGILGTGGAVLGTALPVAFGSGALGALSGAGMSIAGDAILDPAARKVLGTSIQDPLSSGTFGAMAGATGKLALPLTAAVAMSSGDAEAGAIHKLLQKFYHGANGPLQRGAIDSLEVTPQRSVAQHYAERRARQRGGEPTVHEIMTDPFAGKKHGLGVSGGNVTQARRLSEQDRPVRIKVDGEWEEFAGGGLVSKGLKMLFPNAAAPMHVVKPKGGNWLTGSVEGALGGLQRAPGVEREGVETFSGMSDRAIEDAKRTFAIDDWIDGPLTKYVKTRMASPEDEVRALAEQGVLHFEPRGGFARGLYDKRMNAGFPEMGMAKSELAGKWEDVTDAVPSLGSYRDHAPLESFSNETIRNTPSILRRIGGDFAVANPDAQAYAYNRGKSTQDLGFDHLIDELSNALDPNSGLPRHLQLTPEAVKQMSMEKAVRRVADINAWRAEQKVAASKELADKASVVREYTDPALPNPKGLRWVELKAGDPPEGWVKGEGGHKYWRDAEGQVQTQHPGELDLEKQLKYEGETMGHCVGGYCDDVLSGRTRIFSLRDAKGEPHVTVEVQKALSEQEIKPRITQIKGKQNKKPNDEYLPFVQDFVRNSPLGGQWADVGDFHNTGLVKRENFFTHPVVVEFKKRGIELPEYASEDEYIKLMEQATGVQRKAQGGPVRTYPKPTDSPATTGTRGRSPADVVAQFLSEQI